MESNLVPFSLADVNSIAPALACAVRTSLSTMVEPIAPIGSTNPPNCPLLADLAGFRPLAFVHPASLLAVRTSPQRSAPSSSCSTRNEQLGHQTRAGRGCRACSAPATARASCGCVGSSLAE
eukprot:scaffold797_cov236-Pinguiococcus_pyrenoidosus.AAC.5